MCISPVHIIFIPYVSFLTRVKMNSTNWPATMFFIYIYQVDLSIITFDNQAVNVLVFIAQLVERCSSQTQRPYVRIPLKPRNFFRLIRNFLNCYYNCDDHINSFEVCLVVQDTDWAQHGGNHLVVFMKDSKTDA